MYNKDVFLYIPIIFEVIFLHSRSLCSHLEASDHFNNTASQLEVFRNWALTSPPSILSIDFLIHPNWSNGLMETICMYRSPGQQSRPRWDILPSEILEKMIKLWRNEVLVKWKKKSQKCWPSHFLSSTKWCNFRYSLFHITWDICNKALNIISVQTVTTQPSHLTQKKE